MSLTVFDLSPLVKIKAIGWQKRGGIIRQRSEFTAKTRRLRIGPAARYQCTLSFVPTSDPEEVRIQRSFQATFSQPDIAFRIPIVELPQITTPGWPTFCRVKGAGQAGLTLLVDGLPPSATVLRNGHMISVGLTADDDQPLVLRSDMISNGAGEALLTLDEPLRSSPPDDAVVQINKPLAIMQLDDAVGWGVQVFGIHDFPDLAAVEAF